MRQLPELDESCFVQMGDFVKAAFSSAVKREFPKIYVGAMVGKLTKMCQGLSVTHAWKAEIDRDILAESAQEVGAPADLVEEIRAAETARFAAERLAVLGLAVKFHRTLASKAIRSLKTCYPGNYHLTILVCDFEGRFICRLDEDEAL
jgi:cobalt-precorrin-5B (C1)-methyltransferase